MVVLCYCTCCKVRNATVDFIIFSLYHRLKAIWHRSCFMELSRPRSMKWIGFTLERVGIYSERYSLIPRSVLIVASFVEFDFF